MMTPTATQTAMTTQMGQMTATTDPRGGTSVQGRRGLSARARVLGWILVLVGTAALGSVLVSRQVLVSGVDRQVNAELVHEANKFRAFAASNVDPNTGRQYTSADELLARYLERNLPEHGETFFSLVDGQPARRSPASPAARLDKDQGFVKRVATASQPTSGSWPSTVGDARYAVIPIRVAGDPGRGALVVVEFRDQLRAQVNHVVRILAVVAALSLLLAGVAGWAVAGRVLAPVRLMRRTAEAITESDLTGRIEVAGNDDVAALARTFNTMLDRLESAFTAQRQFLDDAGHELRTPITVIRGHLELMGDDPEDRAATETLVVDELDRMRRIVDDLLLLAKAERPDFLTPGEVELADLTVSVLAKARPMADRRWTVDAVAEQVVRADGQRLTQALMQLAANAARHTAAGDEIGVGSALTGDRVRLWVRDTGEGIAVADQVRVFDRFARGASGRRGSEGAGLGLAIVRRIAEAHGGRVLLDSDLGRGATFTLDLPLIPAAATTAELTSR
jgi:two-component system OmpR family sensor kinase